MATAAEKAAAKAAKEAEKAAAEAEADAAAAAAGGATPVVADPAPATSTKNGEIEIEVGDPEELRPVELPLVIKPAKGKDWLNEAQAEFAAVLNGYAYKNPKKWAKKKGTLIDQLQKLGVNPELIFSYRGEAEGSLGRLEYKDKRIGQ